MIQDTEPTWANVNTDDPQEMAEFNEQEDRKAGERVKEAFHPRLRLLSFAIRRRRVLCSSILVLCGKEFIAHGI
jgi:hypothetical protein